MKQVNYQEQLEKEKEKLGRLVNEALKNGVPIINTAKIIAIASGYAKPAI